jgi:Xaa-Pro dipeptidase
MNEQNLHRAWEHLKSNHIPAALLSDPATITWLTGYASPIQTGASPFEGGPALAWLQDGQITIILSDAEAGALETSGASIRDYLSYTIDEPLAGAQNQAAALQEVIKQGAASPGKVAVEFNHLSATMLKAFQEIFPNAQLLAMDGTFNLLRAVKTETEIEKIRAALKLCDLAQQVARTSIKPGLSEIELWCAIKTSLETTAACRVPVLADLVGGLRTADIGGLPGSYALQPGDALIADVVPRLDGYWGDSAGTYLLEEPQAELKKSYQIVREVLQKGVEAARPGMRACDLDALMRSEIQRQGYDPYPHHSGHGIGTTFHEEPRIVPYNNLPLEAGMIIALEPGIYLPGVGGIRLEDVVLILPHGNEILTTHLNERN